VVAVLLDAREPDAARERVRGHADLPAVVVRGDRRHAESRRGVAGGERERVAAVGTLALHRVLQHPRVCAVHDQRLGEVVGHRLEAALRREAARHEQRGDRRHHRGAAHPRAGVSADAAGALERLLGPAVERRGERRRAQPDREGEQVLAREHADEVAAEVLREGAHRAPVLGQIEEVAGVEVARLLLLRLGRRLLQRGRGREGGSVLGVTGGASDQCDHQRRANGYLELSQRSLRYRHRRPTVPKFWHDTHEARCQKAPSGVKRCEATLRAWRASQDRMSPVRLALRSLRQAPAVTGVVVLSLALGIGANSAIFGLADQILIRLLPVQKPRELVQLRLEGGRVGSQSGDGLHTFSHPLYLAFRDRNTVLAGLTGQIVQPASLVGDERSERVSVGMVAGNFFDVLGVSPYLGRLLHADDDRTRNGQPVAVLQHGFWRTRFAGDKAIVGSTIRLNGTPFTVVGIADPAFEGTDSGLPTNLWVPVMMKPSITPTWDDLDNERSAWFYLFGRLKPGVALEEAQAALRVLYSQRQQEELQAPYFLQFPDQKERFLKGVLTLIPASRGMSNLRDRFEQPLLVLQWLVALVLLIACANVASLLLARAAARQKEMAIRIAIGAPRGRLVGQLLLESLLLAGFGGAAGVLVSFSLSRALLRFLPFDPANLSLTSTPDLRLLAFTAGITLLTSLVFGLVPALSGSRVAPSLTLKDESGVVAGGQRHVRLRKALVAVQIG